MDLSSTENLLPPLFLGWSFIGSAIISIGLSALAGLLLKPDKPKVKQEDQPTSLSTRGAHIPLIIGRHRTGAVFGWAGDRKSESEDVGGKFGGGGGTRDVFYESGWHQICVGCVEHLYAVYQNGRKIFPQKGQAHASASNTPSGATIDAGDEGSFQIYWGNHDQPVCSYLAKQLGIESRWPSLCYVVWNRKKLGGTTNWPQLEYEVSTPLTASSTLANSNYKIEETITFNDQDPDNDITYTGINPAHILLQILNSAPPVGIGLSGTHIDENSLEDLGVLCENEKLLFNMKSEEGDTAEKFLQAILQDVGAVMPQIGRYLTFIPIRESADVPVVPNNAVSLPRASVRVSHQRQRSNRILYSFTNEKQNYRQYDIKMDDDATAVTFGAFKINRRPIQTATNGVTARRIANRRLQEDLSNQSEVELDVLREARLLMPGQVFDLDTVGRLRVVSREWKDQTANTRLTCLIDTYSVAQIDPDDPGSDDPEDDLPAEKDIDFTWFELPESFSTDPAIVVFRVRANQNISQAGVWISEGGNSYDYAGDQNTAAAGGLLQSAIASGTSDIIEEGPIIEPDNQDISNVLDFSNDEESWQSGSQLALINNEIFFLRNVTIQAEDFWLASTSYNAGDVVLPTIVTGVRFVAIAGGASGSDEPNWPTSLGETVIDGGVTWEARQFRWQLEGMIRARLGTSKQAHGSGDRVFIIERKRLTKLQHPLLRPQSEICVKTEPATDSDIVDLSSVTPICKIFEGLAVGDPDLLLTRNNGPLETNTGERIKVNL